MIDLTAFGVGGDALVSQTNDVEYPKPVQGRVAHIDADFIAYQVSAETKDELDDIKPRKTLEDMKHNAKSAAEHLMRSAGATSYACHITPSASTKGGRAAQAVQQEYQASRQNRVKPEHCDAVRGYIGQELNGVVHLDQEADDGMTQANVNAEDRNLSVIVSMDKDLRMAPGLHYDFATNEIVNVEGFGSIWLDDSKTAKTVKGWGTSFFWAQCLMGDAADYIKGIPAVPGRVQQAVKPTQAYSKLIDQWVAAADTPKADVVQARIDAEHRKSKACGAVLTHTLLEGITNDRDAFEFVRATWQRLETDCGYEFTHWRTGEVVTSTQALLGDMLLLWMRRNKNPLDVLAWIKGDPA